MILKGLFTEGGRIYQEAIENTKKFIDANSTLQDYEILTYSLAQAGVALDLNESFDEAINCFQELHDIECFLMTKTGRLDHCEKRFLILNALGDLFDKKKMKNMNTYEIKMSN